MKLEGNLVNVLTHDVYPAEVTIRKGVVEEVREVRRDFGIYLAPGFVDGHIHIESSLLAPSRFAEAALPHGTTCVIADPHEIANVLGLRGIEYMLRDASRTPLKFRFSAPSCVPATEMESAGADLSATDIEALLSRPEFVALGEVMNFPGVVAGDQKVMAKLEAARRAGKPIDGHAPGLTGSSLCRYVAHGISTDHECTTLEEAREKARLGMTVQIREGSASHDLRALLPLISEAECMLVSDDKDPEDLLRGHMDETLRRAVEYGLDPMKALRCVTCIPSRHYRLGPGAIVPGAPGDIVMFKSMTGFEVKKVYINGKLVADRGRALFGFSVGKEALSLSHQGAEGVGLAIHAKRVEPRDFAVRVKGTRARVRVIGVIEGKILTERGTAVLKVRNGEVQPDLDADVLKLAVVDRYERGGVANAFVRGFDLRSGALASSISHDAHNIVVVGTNSEEMASAVSLVAKFGGLAAVHGSESATLPLPVAGLMSTESARKVARSLSAVHKFSRKLGCSLSSPFMTLSFLALLVIPELKLGTRGLFDVREFRFVDVVEEIS
ncbi:MAG: adenine deaminase [Candidatus Thermoplasmatota archaeon]